MEIADKLRAARKKCGKTQERVAREAGMHTTQYNAYEMGRSGPLERTLERLAGPLETTVAALLEVEGKSPTEPTLQGEEHSMENLREGFRTRMASLLNLRPEELIVRVELA